MGVTEWLGALAIGLIAGLIAARTVNRGHDLIANLFIGAVGAGAGAWLGAIFALPLAGLLVAGAAAAIVLLALLSRLERAR
jgi:uncharacterized membrane protein YeaQ/YmgE (transglycosylase-associated protein family)